ncbi:MAG: DNA polymerase III subunit gamma/tau [Saprospiraceae bacterium]|nr:DNA polymerase III subunit gamma/tau [Saprospiraceae bacterium]
MSKFIVSARKYRPVTFDQLVGQDHIARTLKNALQTDQLAHAFLFCGPRGVGKTTSARILAKVINCENPQNNRTEPCNNCGSCKAFNDNASFNIIELDAASNNSVEHIRTLIEQVRFQPQHGSYKVFIIDEVHMLSSQAFNAFLKTLEEPPPYAIFILATTEKHKIIPTILSRCQIFDFKRIQVAEIVSQLEIINKAEGRTADVEALHLIGQKADGAMRDALSIYDKIASASSDHIAYSDVVENLNILDYDYYFKLADGLLRSDLASTLLLLNEIVRKGFEPEQVVVGLAEHLRNLLVLKDPRTVDLLEASEGLKKRYLDQSMLASRSFVLSALALLNECDVTMVRSTHKRLHLEITLGKIAHINNLISEEVISEKKTEFESVTKGSSNPQEVIDLDNKAEHTTEQRQPPLPETAPKAEEEQTETEPVVDPQVINTPSFSNFNSLISKIKTKEAEKAEARKNLSIEAIEDIWNEYTENNQSKSVQTALKVAIKELDRTILRVYTPSGLLRDMIIQETPLLERIRNELGVDNLSLDVRMDLERFPGYEEPQVKKVLTNKEKYEIMVEKNPKLAELKRKFDLKVDKE